ncbi:MAG: hypothetical protein IPM95_03785 [Sphingobacteriales bacterium]|nr:hypothetical protein [Sphingobacteriales bacterium]
MFSAGVAVCQGNCKRACINPTAPCLLRGIQFIVSENGAMKNLAAVLTGLPAGNRNNNGTFNNIGNNGNFWSSTENNTNNAWNRNLNYNNSNANRNNNNKENGFSVRCVRYL